MGYPEGGHPELEPEVESQRAVRRADLTYEEFRVVQEAAEAIKRFRHHKRLKRAGEVSSTRGHGWDGTSGEDVMAGSTIELTPAREAELLSAAFFVAIAMEEEDEAATMADGD